jgi:hypothetical protein
MERVAAPRRISAKYRCMGKLSRRQLSTIKKMVAIFGPAFLLTRCNKFYLPMAASLIEFSARKPIACQLWPS